MCRARRPPWASTSLYLPYIPRTSPLHFAYISAAQAASRAAELGLSPPADLAARLLPLVTERMAAGAAAARGAAAAGGGVSSGGGGVSSGCLAEVLLQEAVGRLALRCGGSGSDSGGGSGGGGGQGAAGAAAEVALRHADFGLA